MNSSKTKLKSDYEQPHLRKIQKQYSETGNFELSHVAERAMRFKNQQHSNCFEELFDAWELYRDEHSREEENMNNYNVNSNDNLPVLPEITKQRSTDDPYTVETIILERHIHEMLYNILLASHYKMKQRKDKLMHELYQYVILKQKKKKKKKSEIIAKYLPSNESAMKLIINHIFDSIVDKHYYRCKVFTQLRKDDIIQYIKQCCCLCFEMVIAQKELSFFPLLFTDPSSSYIAPVVRYDREIKRMEKKSKSFDESMLLKIFKENKAKSGYSEGKHNLSPLSVKTKQILFYTFPGVIVKEQDKVLKKADVFTYDDPSIFLRHDLNWIFSDRLKDRQKKMIKFKKDKSLELDEDDISSKNLFLSASNIADPYQHIAAPKMENKMEKIVDHNGIIKHDEFSGKSQLIQDWVSLKNQHITQLCEEICELIMEHEDNEDGGDYDDEKDEEEQEDNDDEYICNKIASKLLFALIIRSRLEMRLKIANTKHNVSFLNMYNLYKHCTDWKGNKANTNQYLKHGYIVKPIVNSVFDSIFEDSFRSYMYLKLDKKLNRKLHEFIALCCQLIWNIFHHDCDLCPVKFDGNKSLQHFDERIHIKDKTLSMEDSQHIIDYCCFPGIIAKSCWNQFDKQCSNNQIDEESIKKILKYRMWTVLITK